MRMEGIKFYLFIYVIVFGVLVDYGMFVKGIEVYVIVVKSGFELYISVGNFLINMYAKFRMV